MIGTGAQAIVWSLERLGVSVVFGIPGGNVIPLYDALMEETSVRHILVRHEQDAGHAAEGYAMATGKVGVAIATSGPGATNMVTPIADAFMDSVPLLVITGQVFSSLMGSDAFQGADIIGITMPIVKHSIMVTRAEEIPEAIAAAYLIASTGRPGPVLVDISKDAQQESAEFRWPGEPDLPGYRPGATPSRASIRGAVEMIRAAARPVFYVGGGAVHANAAGALLRLVDLVGAPVVTTLMARGVLPDSHPLNLGMPGMHGTVPAVLALQESDLLVVVGARFDERVTGDPKRFARHAKVIHIDIDPAEIGKIRQADLPIVADARDALEALADAWGERTQLPEWWRRLAELRARFPLGYEPPQDGALSPQYVMQRIGELSGPEAIYASGVGQHQMWAAQFISHERPRAWLNSGGAGTMGYAVPAAMGAKLGAPERVVWAIDGDGCFQMTNRELATCAINNIPIKVAIINNSSLGMVRQWQSLFYDRRHSFTDLGSGSLGRPVPDFVLLAESYGALALRVTTADEVDAAIELALATNDRSVVIDFVVSPEAMVWPMVPQGVGNSDIRYALEGAPAWAEE